MIIDIVTSGFAVAYVEHWLISWLSLRVAGRYRHRIIAHRANSVKRHQNWLLFQCLSQWNQPVKHEGDHRWPPSRIRASEPQTYPTSSTGVVAMP